MHTFVAVPYLKQELNNPNLYMAPAVSLTTAAHA
jgi:hypothetical protein